MGLGLVREGRKTKKGLMAWKKIEKLGTRRFPQVKRENEDMRVTRDGGYSQQVRVWFLKSSSSRSNLFQRDSGI